MSFYRDTTGNEVDRGPVLFTVWRGTELVNRWSQESMISSEGQGAMRLQQWPHVGLLGQGQLLRKSDNSERNLKEKERFGCSHKKFMGAFNVDLFGFFLCDRDRDKTPLHSRGVCEKTEAAEMTIPSWNLRQDRETWAWTGDLGWKGTVLFHFQN